MLNRVKKFLSLLAAMLLCTALLAACGGKAAADSFSIHPDADGHGASEAASQAGGGTTSSAANGEDGGKNPGGGKSGSESAPETLQSVTGIIDGAGMGKYYVRLEDGLILEFNFAGADTSGLGDTRPGNPITVFYTGTITGNDTSGATATRMVTP